LGISTSIRAGVKALPTSATAAIILLSDQPLIKDHHIKALIESWLASPDKITAGAYHDSIGVPAIFPAKLFTELQDLKGDQGAKLLLLKHEANLYKIPLPEAELDIDNPEDFLALLAQTPTKKQTLR